MLQVPEPILFKLNSTLLSLFTFLIPFPLCIVLFLYTSFVYCLTLTIQVVITILTGVPGCHKESLCTTLTNMAKDYNRYDELLHVAYNVARVAGLIYFLTLLHFKLYLSWGIHIAKVCSFWWGCVVNMCKQSVIEDKHTLELTIIDWA